MMAICMSNKNRFCFSSNWKEPPMVSYGTVFQAGRAKSWHKPHVFKIGVSEKGKKKKGRQGVEEAREEEWENERDAPADSGIQETSPTFPKARVIVMLQFRLYCQIWDPGFQN
jgi:hypothetical protein